MPNIAAGRVWSHTACTRVSRRGSFSALMITGRARLREEARGRASEYPAGDSAEMAYVSRVTHDEIRKGELSRSGGTSEPDLECHRVAGCARIDAYLGPCTAIIEEKYATKGPVFSLVYTHLFVLVPPLLGPSLTAFHLVRETRGSCARTKEKNSRRWWINIICYCCFSGSTIKMPGE